MLSEKSLCYYFNVATSELAEPRGSVWAYGHAERERAGWVRALSASAYQCTQAERALWVLGALKCVLEPTAQREQAMYTAFYFSILQ